MRIVVVDSFTDRPFTGNPAGVCLLDQPASDAWMQAVAAEMKHSETAFLEPAPDPGVADYQLRWFTPLAEVTLCGHATLAAAHVVFGQSRRATVRFMTKSGVLSVERHGDGLLAMDFPLFTAVRASVPDGLIEALGVPVGWAGGSRFDILAEVADEVTVRTLAPDIAALARIEARGFIVTARADVSSPYDYVSRFFAPSIGIPEDPVTGSSHCVLASYWGDRLGAAPGEPLTGAQLSARGGVVQTMVRGDRAELAGRAVTVFDGTLSALASAVTVR